MRVSPRFAQAKAPFFYVANLAVRIIVCLIHLNELSSNMHSTQDINFDITTKGAKVHFEGYTTLILSPSIVVVDIIPGIDSLMCHEYCNHKLFVKKLAVANRNIILS